MECMYKNSEDNKSRYILGTKGKNPVFIFGINPSTAEPNKPDATIKKIEKISQKQGYDSWIMMNVYPVRMTKFAELPKSLDESEHQRNIEVIKEQVSKYTELDVWVAFGNNILNGARSELIRFWKDIVASLEGIKINWLATNINKKGTPRHPLYEKDDSTLKPFDMNTFLSDQM
ncbi:MAG: DUF1643 domain-containing protein [Streptococcaceae bacterium]|nr:DUF1643 domain-containing protein [Streptococcaceae bacterium]MCL2681314.1 DUF1643 domain-containing protein [Streptococcaceae bacterium]